VMMSMLCNCCVRELLILARTWFAFGLPSKTGCDSAMDVLIIKNFGENHQELGKGQGVEEEEQGRPQQEGDQVRLDCDSISGFRSSLHQNGHPGRIRTSNATNLLVWQDRTII
jgi:hypothetical protein